MQHVLKIPNFEVKTKLIRYSSEYVFIKHYIFRLTKFGRIRQNKSVSSEYASTVTVA